MARMPSPALPVVVAERPQSNLMAKKPEKPEAEDDEDKQVIDPRRLARPVKRKPYNRMLKPDGRIGGYETK